MKNALKTVGYMVSQLLYDLLRLLRLSPPRVYVLMYHSIEDTAWKYGVSAKNFEMQLAHLQKKFTVVTLQDVVAYSQGDKILKDKSVALTFDDGYAGVYEHAFPLAKKYSVPFTIFLSTDLSESKAMGNLKRLTWEQVREMSESGLVSIEAHGHEHANFAALEKIDSASVEKNITTCIRLIQENTGHVPTHFAYPSGHRSTSVAKMLALYFESASSITEGTIRVGDDPYALRRVQVDRTMSLLQFRLRIAGGIDIHRSMVDWLRRYIPL